MKHQEAVLIIDLGLTNCKVSLFATSAALIAQHSQRYPTTSPQPGLSEQAPDDWFAAVCKAMAHLNVATLEPHVTISAIAVTGHMHGLVGLDAAGHAVAPCWTLFDQRAQREARHINQEVPAAYAITGARLEAYTPAAKMLWMKRNLPETWRKVHAFVAPKDVLRVWLGGDLCSDPIDAAGLLLVELNSGAWSDELLAAAGVPPVPEIRAAWSRAGSLSAAAASLLGLRAGIPIYTGAGDDIEALGAGLVAPGQTLEHLGTTGTLVTCTAKPLLDPDERLEAYPHVVPGRYLVGGATNAAGLSLDWVARLLGRSQGNGAKHLQLRMPVAHATAPYYLPWIRGERGLLWEPEASGAFLGLREEHGAAEVAYAAFEGVALSIHAILDAICRLGADVGLRVDGVLSGTPLDDKAWAVLRASAYGRPMLIPAARDLTGLGCALVALTGMGVFPDVTSAVHASCRTVESIAPDAEWQAYLAERFATYTRLTHSIQEVNSIIAEPPLIPAQEHQP